MPPIAANPLLQPWTAPHGLPPFDLIEPAHFGPACEAAVAEHRAQIEAIATQAAAPTFDNTAAALDASGRRLQAISHVLRNLAYSHTSPELQAVERTWAPRLAAHFSSIARDVRLFARLDALHRGRAGLGLAAEQLRLIERLHLDAVLAGAQLADGARRRLGEIVERLAQLSTQFGQNVLAEEQQCLWLGSEVELAGLPESARASARAAAVQRGRADAWAITLGRSSVVPFLTYSTRRDLRERAFKLWKGRGARAGAHDNRPLAREILALRSEQAALCGYASYADFALVDRMAGRPAAVTQLLAAVWEPAKRRAAAEQAALAALATEQGGPAAIEAWDWHFYAEAVRKARYALDDAQLKPYFALQAMLGALFDCAQRLFGLHFAERTDLPRYHPSVRMFEASAAGGAPVGLFIFDNFARPTKRSGAWMSVLRWQSRAHGAVLPVILNNSNFAPAAPGESTLLSLDDVRTLFHEFGHGLHGLLSDVGYERLSGTQVLRDFVELPSQLFEHWALVPAVLKRHARHVQSGEPIPDALIERLLRARQFNQGFETVGYTASALVDLALHQRSDTGGLDIEGFERAELARLGLPAAIAPFHHLAHFQHLFAGGYAAGYYVYLWAEVLDADAFNAFVEAGDPFDAATAQRLLAHIYASGNTVEPGAAYRAFRGRDATVEPLLAKRGLLEPAA